MERFRWFGLILVLTEWGGFLTMLQIRSIDIALPISQYGAYPETKLLFSATLVGAAIFAGLFGIYLQRHHNRSFIIALAASAAFAWAGLISYDNAHVILGASHWISALFSGFFYFLLIYVVEKNKGPSLLRSIFLFSTVSMVFIAVYFRVTNQAVASILLFELISIVSAQLWLALSSFDTTSSMQLRS